MGPEGACGTAPEGQGSVSGAPNLSTGFAGYFSAGSSMRRLGLFADLWTDHYGESVSFLSSPISR